MPKRRPEHVPQRSCAVCRQVRAKRSMDRLVRGADGTIARDPSGKASGRGTYVCHDAACREPTRLAEAVQRALGARLAPGALESEVNDAAT